MDAPEGSLASSAYKFFYVCAENSLGAWFAAYAELSCLVSAVDAPNLGALFYWCYTITRIVSAVLSSRVSSTIILTVCYIGGICGFVLVTLSGSGEGNVSMLWIGTVRIYTYCQSIACLHVRCRAKRDEFCTTSDGRCTNSDGFCHNLMRRLCLESSSAQSSQAA